VRTDRTNPNNKPNIIIRDNKQGACILTDVATPGDRNVIKKESENILKYEDLITYSAHVEYASYSDTGSNRDNCNHLKTTQTIPEQQTGRARN